MPQRLLERIRESGIKWMLLQFTGLDGFFREVTVSSKLFNENTVLEGFGKLDGSSIRGFKDISESDLVLKPVIHTFAIDPFLSSTGRVISNIYNDFGRKRFERDPRWTTERIADVLRSYGLRAKVSAELEFHIFDKVEVWMNSLSSGYKISSNESGIEYKVNDGIPAKEGYYHITPTDKFMELRTRISELLNDYYHIFVECHHHEVGASGQGEINFSASGPTETGDTIQTIKYVAKNVASMDDKILTFMPKPVFGDNGSGMHMHISLWKDDENMFHDPDDEYAGVSQEARYFIGGLLFHAKALSAIVSPTVNSYKRLVPGYEAPVYLAWSRGNRSAAIRVPVYHKGNPSSARIEYRPPDPSANPYLAISSVIAAGLDGIIRKIDPGDPVDENIYHLSEGKRVSLGIKQLPSSLKEALDELESDHDFLRNVFSSSLIESYIELKREEWNRVVNRVSPAEIYYYISY